jgi:hypothetical protein
VSLLPLFLPALVANPKKISIPCTMTIRDVGSVLPLQGPENHVTILRA